MNYEDEIEEKIINSLKYKYNFLSDEIAYRYIIIKNELLKIIDKNTDYFNEDTRLMNFIFKELNINTLIYKECKISTYGFENNFINILDNLKYRYENNNVINEKGVEYTFDNYIKNVLNEIIIYSNKESKFLKNKANYNEINAYFRLKKLNELFNITDIKYINKIEGFQYNDMVDISLSIEEELERYYHAVNFNTNSLKTITEEDFEDYVYKNIEKIEVGLKLIERQYKIDNGRIDILAKDKDNKYVIIELKIANDKHLIWQVLYYPVALKRQLKIKDISDIRVITICPEYPDYIETPLKEIGNIEMIKYKANISNKKIRKVEFKKI